MSNLLIAKKHPVPILMKKTELHTAFYKEKYVDCRAVTRLLKDFDEKQDYNNYEDSHGLTHMHIACTKNKRSMVAKYLHCGSDVNAQVKFVGYRYENFTPLHFTIMYESHDVVKLLLEKGADIDANDGSKHGTPLHIALKNKNKYLASLLLKKGADAKAIRPFDEATTLHALVERKYIKLRAPRKCTGGIRLHTPAFSGLESTFFRLLLKGVDINAKDKLGNTALHVLCEQKTSCSGYQSSSNKETSDEDALVQLFIRFGADVEIRNNAGQTVIEMMCSLENKKLVEKMYNRTKCKIIFDHIENMKALDREVCLQTEQYLLKFRQRIRYEHYNSFTEEQMLQEDQQRLDQVKKLKTLALDDSTSIYDFLQMDVESARKYLTQPDLKVLLDNEFSPVFDYFVIEYFRQAGEFRQVKDMAKKRFVMKKKPQKKDSDEESV